MTEIALLREPWLFQSPTNGKASGSVPGSCSLHVEMSLKWQDTEPGTAPDGCSIIVFM